MAKTWGDYPLIKLAGREFQRVPRSALQLNLSKRPPPTPEALAEREFENPPEEFVLMAVHDEDPKCNFPGNPPFESAGPLLKAGIAMHTVGFMERPDAWSGVGGSWDSARRGALKLTARDLVVHAETDWYGECFAVLEAHGWTRGGKLKDDMMAKIMAVEGTDFVKQAQEQFGENWEAYAEEVAATYFAEPLSRLWYVANMKSLYYCHCDDLRFGYLWAEYQIKMRYEIFALKHIDMTDRNRENGQKGGGQHEKQQRYTVLDQLARQRFKKLAFASDRAGRIEAKKMAADYDFGAPEPLFMHKGRELSAKWYDEWLAHYRELARGDE